jgi:uncharacterized cysteine cluster protein YcgN (CxxCxxCC family)
LPGWHHLVSGNRRTVHGTGRSVHGRAVSETAVEPEALEDRLVDWPHLEND